MKMEIPYGWHVIFHGNWLIVFSSVQQVAFLKGNWEIYQIMEEVVTHFSFSLAIHDSLKEKTEREVKKDENLSFFLCEIN